MSYQHIRTTQPKARVEHSCDAFDGMLNEISEFELQERINEKHPELLDEYEKMKSNGFKIQKGEVHFCIMGRFEGKLCGVRYSKLGKKLVELFNFFED